ncbi:MAG TPA: hypothetical protein VGN95_16100 [Pyrinomonadaceae bacterium]|nr:hypothetical protein [Pyrinomonadaceae bacterium]
MRLLVRLFNYGGDPFTKGRGMSGFKNIILAPFLILLSVLSYPIAVSAQNVHPVVDIETGCLLGGVADGKWLEAEAIAPLIKGGERYRFYTLKGFAGKAVGAKVDPTGDPCGRSSNVAFEPEAKEGFAVDERFNAMPRTPKMLSASDPAYRQMVAGILRSHGIRRPLVNITQLLHIDLDGDGTDEVLVSATHLAEGIGGANRQMAVHSKPGDYSLVFLRKIVKGRAQNIILSEDYHLRNNDSTPFQFRIAAVLDVNGDGKMEIIVHGDYYEGGGSTLYRLIGNKVKEAFGCSCGE